MQLSGPTLLLPVGIDLKKLAAAGLAAMALSAGAAIRSSSIERAGSGFNAYLPLPAGRLGVSCTDWMGSSNVCIADASSLGRQADIQLWWSARYGMVKVISPEIAKTRYSAGAEKGRIEIGKD
jgi:hypothetical protein